ncbi:hypothetical protein P9112_008097 [Eukaryota sp. TZLM1-RC]
MLNEIRAQNEELMLLEHDYLHKTVELEHSTNLSNKKDGKLQKLVSQYEHQLEELIECYQSEKQCFQSEIKELRANVSNLEKENCHLRELAVQEIKVPKYRVPEPIILEKTNNINSLNALSKLGLPVLIRCVVGEIPTGNGKNVEKSSSTKTVDFKLDPTNEKLRQLGLKVVDGIVQIPKVHITLAKQRSINGVYQNYTLDVELDFTVLVLAYVLDHCRPVYSNLRNQHFYCCCFFSRQAAFHFVNPCRSGMCSVPYIEVYRGGLSREFDPQYVPILGHYFLKFAHQIDSETFLHWCLSNFVFTPKIIKSQNHVSLPFCFSHISFYAMEPLLSLIVSTMFPTENQTLVHLNLIQQYKDSVKTWNNPCQVNLYLNHCQESVDLTILKAYADFCVESCDMICRCFSKIGQHCSKLMYGVLEQLYQKFSDVFDSNISVFIVNTATALDDFNLISWAMHHCQLNKDSPYESNLKY